MEDIAQLVEHRAFNSFNAGSSPVILKYKSFVLMLANIVNSLILIVAVLVALAYLTLAERKVMGSMQRRLGPNVVGIYGLGQPIMDGLKLVLKETITPMHSNKILYNLAPMGNLILALVL